jgi:hypothetical protein
VPKIFNNAFVCLCEDLGQLFGNGSLDGLVGATRQVNPHLAKLRHLGNVGVVGRLGVLRLDLKRLLNRLSTYQLLKRAGRVLNRRSESRIEHAPWAECRTATVGICDDPPLSGDSLGLRILGFLYRSPVV